MTNDMPELPSLRLAPTRRIPIVMGAVLIGGLIGFAGVHGIGGLKHQAPGGAARRGAGGIAQKPRRAPACRGAVDLAQKLAPLAHGEVAALTVATAPLRLPDLAFEDAEGKPKKLSDWRGGPLLVNPWGTLCVPPP